MAVFIGQMLSNIIGAEEIDLPPDQLFRKIGVAVPVLLATVLFSYQQGSPLSCFLDHSSSAPPGDYINNLCRSSEWFPVGTTFNVNDTAPEPIAKLTQEITWFLFFQAFGHAMIFWMVYQLPVQSSLQPLLSSMRKLQDMGENEIADVKDEEMNPVTQRKERISKILKERCDVLRHSKILQWYCAKTLLSFLYQIGFCCYYIHMTLQHMHYQVLCWPSSGPFSNRTIHCSVLTAPLSIRFAYLGFLIGVIGFISVLVSISFMDQRDHNVPHHIYRRIPEMLKSYNMANGDKQIDELDFKAFIFNTKLTEIVSRQIIFAVILVRYNIDQSMSDDIFQNVFEQLSIEQFLETPEHKRFGMLGSRSGSIRKLKTTISVVSPKPVQSSWLIPKLVSIEDPQLRSVDLLNKDLTAIHISKCKLRSAEVCLAKALFRNPPITETYHCYALIRVFNFLLHLFNGFYLRLDDIYFKTIIRNEVIDRVEKMELLLHNKEKLLGHIKDESERLELNDIEVVASLFKRRILIIQKYNKKSRGLKFVQVTHDFNFDVEEEEEEEGENGTSQVIKAEEIIYLLYDKRESYSLYKEKEEEEEVRAGDRHVVTVHMDATNDHDEEIDVGVEDHLRSST